MRRLSSFILTLVMLCLFSTQVFASEAMARALKSEFADLRELVASLQTTVKDLRSTVQDQNEVIQKQTIRINALESGQVAPQTAPGQDKLKMEGLSQGFNPEIGVVGTVQAQFTESSEDAEGKDTIALKELELNIAQYVDPYSRLDAIIAFNDNLEAQNVDIEEAYYSHWGLPFGFTGRVGKFRAKAGKQNLAHLDQLETVDYPFVIQNFFGEEGMSSSGVRLQNQIPNPWDLPLTLTGEVFRGNNGDSFSGISRRPVFNTHISTFFQVGDDVDVELGSNWMVGDENASGDPKGEDRFNVHIFGFDKTVHWHLDEGRKVKWQSELFVQERTSNVTPNHNPWGFYSLVDFRFLPQWSGGIRFDFLEPREVALGHDQTTVVSPYLTFHQSEFANFTVQYRHLDPADPDEKTDDAVFLQAKFFIGAHSHPVA